MIRHIVNIILWLLPPSRLFYLRQKLLKYSGISLDSNVCFCGRGWIYGRGVLQIGMNTWLSPGSVFYTHLESKIKLGANCDIGPSVEFITGGHIIGSNARRAGQGTTMSIVIEDGCWIGARVTILGGVTIGEGSVIGAGALVIDDIPPNSLALGVPAKVKRKLEISSEL